MKVDLKLTEKLEDHIRQYGPGAFHNTLPLHSSWPDDPTRECLTYTIKAPKSDKYVHVDVMALTDDSTAWMLKYPIIYIRSTFVVKGEIPKTDAFYEITFGDNIGYQQFSLSDGSYISFCYFKSVIGTEDEALWALAKLDELIKNLMKLGLLVRY